MDRTFNATISAAPSLVMPIVSDLGTYPHWLDLVQQTELDGAVDLDSADFGKTAEPAWLITLRAKIGPFARSKRLRMVRTHHEVIDSDDNNGGGSATFERRELDDREHSPWVMKALVEPGVAATRVSSTSVGGATSELSVSLSYGGNLWSGPLELVLGSALESTGTRLSEYAAQHNMEA